MKLGFIFSKDYELGECLSNGMYSCFHLINYHLEILNIKIFGSNDIECFLEYNMLQMNSGYPPLHLSSQTRSGEMSISEETPDTKILCSKERMYLHRRASDRSDGILKESFYL